jgi:hypothetical protein
MSLQLAWCCGMRLVKETFGKRGLTGITSVSKSGRSKNTVGPQLSRHLRTTSRNSCQSTLYRQDGTEAEGHRGRDKRVEKEVSCR